MSSDIEGITKSPTLQTDKIRCFVPIEYVWSHVDNSGKIIDSQNDVGGWDSYPSVRRPANWDTDGDGMPNAWEKSRGLNPSDAGDGKGDRNSDGFTNL